jgi:hypothetical protein
MTYADIVFSTKEVTFAIDLIVLFMILYYCLVSKKVPLVAILIIEVLVVIIGAFFYIMLCNKMVSVRQIMVNAIRFLGVLVAVVALSP